MKNVPEQVKFMNVEVDGYQKLSLFNQMDLYLIIILKLRMFKLEWIELKIGMYHFNKWSMEICKFLEDVYKELQNYKKENKIGKKWLNSFQDN